MPRDAMMFVDQENLRNGANQYNSDYKYDFEKLRDVLLEDYHTIRSYWFASWHPENQKPKAFYKKLELSEYRLYESPRVPRESQCSECGTTHKQYIEKGVDIQLATEFPRVKFDVNCGRRRRLRASFELSLARHC